VDDDVEVVHEDPAGLADALDAARQRADAFFMPRCTPSWIALACRSVLPWQMTKKSV
jgi:hypothetical protein